MMWTSRATSPSPSPWNEAPVIVGTGIDVVSIPRFADALRRWPRLGDRLFTERERRTTTGKKCILHSSSRMIFGNI